MDAHEDGVRRLVQAAGPRAAFEQLTRQNDALCRGPALDNGRDLAAARTAIYTQLIAHWAEARHRELGYSRPFGVAAVGGTGRGEMARFSDTDFVLLFDDAVEGNPFLAALLGQVLHTTAFAEEYGFGWRPYPFALDDVTRLEGKQLNAFLDIRPVYDPGGLVTMFRERIRETYDPFEHFLHVRGFWKSQWEKSAAEWERLDRFDIKTDGLRVFLAGVWTLAGKDFRHSLEVYQDLEDERDLKAYDFLMRIRAFIHAGVTVRPPSQGEGLHGEDVLGFEEFTSFGEMLGAAAGEEERYAFANEVRARLLAARRRVARFTKGVIERELKDGRSVSPRSNIVYGVAGLQHALSHHCEKARDKSQAALSLLLASQRYGVPIDPLEQQTTFRDAGDWLLPVPELSALFYETRGSLADSFAYLAQFDGALERLFPGYGRFEVSLDARVSRERLLFRGALERQKGRILERYLQEGQARLAAAVSPDQMGDPAQRMPVEVEAALLDADHLAAVKLALKTKRLPVTAEDWRVRADRTLGVAERSSSGLSGIPVEDYYRRYEGCCEFSEETLRTAEFLVAHRRAFKERARAGMNDAESVREFARLCGDEQRLRSLYVFTCADRAEWEGEQDDPVRWFNTRELYAKTMAVFRPIPEPTRHLEGAGFSREELDILKDFGDDLYTGVYRRYANQFGSHLVRLVEEPATTRPKAALLREGAGRIIAVAARDFRGLAASVTGALWHQDINLRQAHLFSATRYRLALDFLHVETGEKAPGPGVLRAVEEAIERQLHIDDSAEAGLPATPGTTTLHAWRPGLCCLRHETEHDVSGLVYSLAYKVCRHLFGNIFGLTAHAAKGRAYVSVYHDLPEGMTIEEAQARVANW